MEHLSELEKKQFHDICHDMSYGDNSLEAYKKYCKFLKIEFTQEGYEEHCEDF